jgi:hypothetical protein
MTGALLWTTGATFEGKEVSFYQALDGGRFTIASSKSEVQIHYVFNLSPLEAAIAIHRGIETINDGFKLPPPAWAFGHHMTVPKDLQTLSGGNLTQMLETIREDLKFPLEGILQE